MIRYVVRRMHVDSQTTARVLSDALNTKDTSDGSPLLEVVMDLKHKNPKLNWTKK